MGIKMLNMHTITHIRNQLIVALKSLTYQYKRKKQTNDDVHLTHMSIHIHPLSGSLHHRFLGL